MSDLRGLLMRHEGMRLKPYLCPAGRITIGCGRNLEDMGISAEEALHLLDNDIVRTMAEASTYMFYSRLDPVRKDVIVCMIFNMGMRRFGEFKRLIQALNKGDFETAASEMLASRWASQVRRRAVELAEMMKTGKYRD